MKGLVTTQINKAVSELQLVDVNVLGGLQKAKESFLTQIQPIINFVVLPIIDLVLVIILVFLIAGVAAKRKQGQEWSDKIVPICIASAVLILIGSAPLWMWSMIGM